MSERERITCPNCRGDGNNHGHPEDVPEIMACQRCNANGWIYAPDRLLSENAVVEAIDRLYKQGDVFLTGSACRDTIIAIRALPGADDQGETP